MQAITAPGVYDIPAEVYHADPCPVPSLSSGLAKVLVRRSPLHAHHAHPRFGAAEKEPSAAMDNGTIMHRMILGKGDEYAAVEADDWRTKAAKEARDAIRAQGRIPVLARTLDDLRRGAESAIEQMRQHPDCEGFFAPGQSEAVIVREDDGIWMRCMVDRMPADPRLPWYDLKTTGMSAAPVDFQRAMVAEHAFQRSFYRDVGKALTTNPPPFLFVVIEQKAPNGMSVMTCAASLAEVADMEVRRAKALWRRCMQTGRWPGYPTSTAYVEAPAWIMAAEEAAMAEEMEMAA